MYERYSPAPSTSAIIAATQSEQFDLVTTDSEIQRYGPCTRLTVQNLNATITVRVTLNACVFGDMTVQGIGRITKRFDLDPKCVLEIVPSDNMPFYNVVITNTHAANATVAGDVVITAQNE